MFIPRTKGCKLLWFVVLTYVWVKHTWGQNTFCHHEICYTKHKTKVTYGEAKSMCEQNGGSILEILDQETQDVIVSNTDQSYSYWLGLVYDSDSGTYLWENGFHIQCFDAYHPKEPNLPGVEQCSFLETTNRLWGDFGCTSQHSYICQDKAVDPAAIDECCSNPCQHGGTCHNLYTRYVCVCRTSHTGTNCENSILPGRSTHGPDHLGNFYWVESAEKTWDQAVVNCEAHCSYLAILSEEEQYLYLSSAHMVGGERFWIGLNDRDQELSFVWMDGTVLNNAALNLWAENPTQLADPFQNCVVLDESMALRDLNCSIQYKSICMFNQTDSCCAHQCARGSTCINTGTGYTCTCQQGTTGAFCERDLPNSACELEIYGQECVWLTEASSWSDGRASCVGDGGDLAVIDGYTVLVDLLASLNMQPSGASIVDQIQVSGAWIGLADIVTEGVYSWVNKRVLQWENWAKKEVLPPSHDCVYINEEGGWYTDYCDKEKPALCQSTGELKICRGTRDCVDYSQPPSVTSCLSLDNSRRTCGSSSAIQILSPDDNTLAQNFLLDALVVEAKIGLKMGSVVGTWVWPDRLYLYNYTKWEVDSPRDASYGRCVSLNAVSGLWKQVDCECELPVLCGQLITDVCTFPETENTTLNLTYHSPGNIQATYTCHDNTLFADQSQERILGCNCSHSDLDYHVTSSLICKSAENPLCMTEYFNHTGVCYWLGAGSVSWTDAWQSCYSNNGRLALVEDAMTKDFIVSQIGLARLSLITSIGLSNRFNRGVWRWLTTKPLTTSLWGDDQPNIYKEIYGALVKITGAVVMYDKYANADYLCQSYTEATPSEFSCSDESLGCFDRNASWTDYPDRCVKEFNASSVSVHVIGVPDLASCKALCVERIDFNCRSVVWRLVLACDPNITGICYLTSGEVDGTDPTSGQDCVGGVTAVRDPPTDYDFEEDCLAHVAPSGGFSDVLAKCDSSWNGTLVMPRDKVHLDHISDFISGRGVADRQIYMGVYQPDTDTRQYTYVDGSHLYADLWKSGEPDAVISRACTSVLRGSGLTATTCTDNLGAICQTKKVDLCYHMAHTFLYTNATLTSNGSVLVVSCLDYHTFPDNLTISATLICDCNVEPNLKLLHTTQQCSILDCGEPDFLTDTMELVNQTYTTVVFTELQYRCTEGYWFNGSLEAETAKCTENRTWVVTGDNCTVVTCGLPTLSTHMTINRTQSGNSSQISTEFNTTLHMSCDTGYEFSPNITTYTTTCLANATWSDFPSCVAVDCGPYTTLNHTHTVTQPNTSTTYNTSVLYRCHYGYRSPNLTLSYVSTCLSDAHWSLDYTDFECEAVTCSNESLVPLPHTIIVSQNMSVGSSDTVLACVNDSYWFEDHTTNTLLSCDLDDDTNVTATYQGWPETGCQVIDCGNTTSVPYGVVDFTATIVTSTAVHTCLHGYHFTDWAPSHESTCAYNGTWTDIGVECEVTDCGSLTAISSSVVTYTQRRTFVGDTATLVCTSGYEFENGKTQITLSCLTTGDWSDVNTLCVLKDCGGLNASANAALELDRTTFGSEAVFTCDPGYATSLGNQTVVIGCNASGLWEIPEGVICQAIDCGTPPDLILAVTSYNQTTYQHQATYTCIQGYQFTDQSAAIISQCLNDSTWSEVTENCLIQDCGPPLPVNNTEALYTNTTYLSPVVYQGLPGYVFAGLGNILTLVCREDGEWPQNNVSVTLINCGSPPPMINSRVESSGHVYGDVASYFCKEGTYFTDLTDAHTKYCTNEGRWWPGVQTYCRYDMDSDVVKAMLAEDARSRPNPEYKTCSPLRPPLSVIQIEAIPITLGYAYYRCLPGYQLPTGYMDSVYLCDETTHWRLREMAECQRMQCPELQALGVSNCSTEERYVGTQVTCICPDGKTFEHGRPQFTTVCSGKKTWSSDYRSCDTDRCEPLPYIRNADATSPYSTSEGQSVQIACHPGHRFFDGRVTRYITCLSGRVWQDIGHCLVDVCPSLLPPEHGSVNSSMALFGTSVRVECDTGFTFTRGNYSLVIYCEEGGVWSEEYPDCTEILCDEAPVVKNCEITGTERVFDSVVQYRCGEGFGLNPQLSEDTYRVEDGFVSVEIVCQQDSHWSRVDFTCELGRCPPVPELTLASPNDSLATNTSVIQYTCTPGFVFPSNSITQSVRCMNTQWLVDYSECAGLSCGSPPNISHADQLEYHGTGYLDTIWYHCRPGYLFGTENTTGSLQCTYTASWEVVYPKTVTEVPTACSLLHCGNLPIILGATAPIPDTDTYGSSVTFTCASDMWFERDVYTHSVTCTSEGKWQPAPPGDCKSITCPAVPYWEGLVPNTTTTTASTAINFTCINDPNDNDLKLPDDVPYLESICSTTGVWIPPLAECQEKTTKPPFSPPATEARHASKVGSLGILLVTLTALGLFLSDVRSLVQACRQFVRNLQDWWRDDSGQERGSVDDELDHLDYMECLDRHSFGDLEICGQTIDVSQINPTTVSE